jgi:large subunit ribosomal protein L6
MSRIGRLPIKIPDGVSVEIKTGEVVVKGPKGQLSRKLSHGVSAELKDGNLVVKGLKNEESVKPLLGTERSILFNMVKGVVDGWEKKLELVGTGYRAEVAGKTLTLSVGYSHPVKIEAAEGISFKVEKNIITVEGIDKSLVGFVAANIRNIRPPEPYKGKGIRYVGEVIRRKAGKAAKAAGAG